MLLTVEQWPKPGHPDRARLGLERWQETAAQTGDPALQAFAAGLAEDPAGRRMLDAVFGNSAFLTECLLRDIGFVQELIDRGVDDTYSRLIDATAALDSETDMTGLMAGLRRTRRRAALTIGLADIAGLWSLEQVTAALTGLAETALRLGARHLLRRLAARGAIDLPDESDPERGSGLIVLGMGKLGAGELNYSSDIDLIVLYDDARVKTRQPDTLTRSFVRLTRDLVRIMEERTPEGYVFRVDLRLRPDPGATPVAVSVSAAEGYYGSMAQTWERAAMIKARPVAGDAEAGAAFLGFIGQFVWRRHLDFAAIQDIHKIKRQIQRHRGHGAIAVDGHNIKVGRGGIREIEFFVQTQQLIFGGRDPRLRTARTVDGLRTLAEAGQIDHDAVRDLTAAYGLLRQVEHRLQMLHDQQTHSLPDGDTAIGALAVFLGYDGAAAFRAALRAALARVEDHYADLFEDRPGLAGPPDLVFSGTDEEPETLRALSEMGYENASGILKTVRGWLHGRYRSTRSERVQQLLNDLLPTLLDALAKTPNPDNALFRFDEFVGRLPTGIQVFSLFHANPKLLELVAEIMGTSGRLAEHLAQNPAQLEGVVTPGFFDALPDGPALAEDLERQLGIAGYYEDMLNVVRRWTSDHRFRAGVRLLRGIPDDPDHGPYLSDVADAALGALQPRVEAAFAERHGRFARPGLAIIAMGKLGGREMTIRSDLDLIMVYETTESEEESNGPKPLSPTLYYTRLARRLLSAITAPTVEGPLYEVDMRLRPSGNAGPLTTSLEAFFRYQHESAWTWEHMALTRARVITGPVALREAIDHAIREVLTRPREPDRLLRTVADMRERIEQQHGTINVWDVKYHRGGMVDIEFIAQYLQLRHAHTDPEVLSQNTVTALRNLCDVGVLDDEMGLELIEAMRLWQRIQAYLRLTCDGAFDAEDAPPALRAGLAHAALPDLNGNLDGNLGGRLGGPLSSIDPMTPEGFATVETRVAGVADRTYRLYRAIIEEPAAALGPPEDDPAEGGSPEDEVEGTG